jgi:hypothetical protein
LRKFLSAILGFNTWHLALVLFMIMVFSCAASGLDNLLIGGIWQDQNSQALNLKYAELLGAKFVPTYYSDDGALDKAWGFVADPASVQTATPWYKYDLKTGERVGHFNYLPNDRNGLNNALISGNDDDYDTIYAHSGGARTAVTAMLYQGVSANKLVLIDPARGGQLEADYEYEIQKLLDKGVDIDYYYYKADNILKEPPLSFIWRGGTDLADLQQGGSRGSLKVIPVESKDLGGLTGKDAHIQIFYYVLNDEAKCSPSCPDQIAVGDIPPLVKESETYIITLRSKWTLEDNRFNADWENGARAKLTIENWGPSGVIISRIDSGGVSHGLSARYEGQINGNKIENGKVTWKWLGVTWSGTWNANW